jgi:elongation factor G
MDFPSPVISISVKPKSKADSDKLTKGLLKLEEEDPTFTVRTDIETKEIIISGMGELHLEIIRDRLLREFKVKANAGAPQIAYREHITEKAAGEGRFIRQTGGKGQYGHATITIEPQERGKGIEVLSQVTGGAIPKEFIEPTLEGIREALQSGHIANYPMVDVKVTLTGGSFHEVDSSEIAFKMAGIFAVRDAVQNAGPELLEPVMALEVGSPADNQGDILGDLNRRRARINAIESKGDRSIIKAEVPLSEMFGYATDLRSMTQGRANYSMEFEKYDKVPNNIAEKIIQERGVKKDD